MDDPLPPDPYKTLGVPKDATLATIRSAHRKLVLACHPDKVKVSEESEKKIKAEQFHQVQQAYEILNDDSSRQKYDERVKLAELRAELRDERGPLPRRATEYSSPRTTYTPRSEVRGGRVYEERVPSNVRSYADDYFSSSFADHRPSAKKYDDMFGESRRTSGRAQEDKRRAREVEVERERRAKEAARKAEERDQRERRRAKEKKKDVEAKARSKFTYVQDDDFSDSEVDDRYTSRRDPTPPKQPRYEEVRRRDREEPKRGSTKTARDQYDYDSKASAAQEHINRSREVFREVESEPRNRSSRPRASSNLDQAPPPVAPAPPVRPVDTRRRSSDRERSDKERSGGEWDRRHGRGSKAPSPVRTSSNKKDKKYDFVDPPTTRKPAMPNFTSDPKGLKSHVGSSKKEAQRAATYHSSQELKHPGLRRAETLPIRPRHNDTQPARSSNLKNARASGDSDDSDSSDTTDSDDTPLPPPRSSTKYKVTSDDTSTRTIYMEPEDYERPSGESARTRRPTDRPSLGRESSSMRTPPTRGGSYMVQEERPSSRRTDSGIRPSLNTHASSRGKKLFGAVDDYSSTEEYHRSPHSPKASAFEGRGTKLHSRRGSEDVDRDAYPGSFHQSPRRPSYQRGESISIH